MELLYLDCNQRYLIDDTTLFINQFIARSAVLQNLITQVEEIMDEPSFKQFDSKVLTSYVLESLVADLRTDSNKADMIDSIKFLTNLEVTSTYFASAMDKLYFEEQYISEGSTTLYGQQSVNDLFMALENEKAAAPIFLDFIYDKNGNPGEAECLKISFFEDALVELNS